MIYPKINSFGMQICFNRLVTSHFLNFKSANHKTLCQFWRHFSSNATADISIVAKQASNYVNHNQSLVLSQSEIVDPQTFLTEPLDLTNTNQSITPVREAWVENMSTPNSIKLGIFPLHPSIFSVFPRPDMIQENHKWQTLYKHVDWQCLKTRAEVKGSNRKPWPQKGSGRARHGSRKSPQWINGGWAVGPRGPKTFFYMLPWHKRVNGLISLLASKFSQNDLYVVDSFETFPIDGTSDHLEELCEARGWGPSVLFVDHVPDYGAQSTPPFYNATQDINHINILPVYGLNVFSMLKHETLVFTVDAIKDVQKKLLFQLNRVDLKNVVYQYKPDGVYRL